MCNVLALTLILASHHFATYHYNNRTPGVAVQCDHLEVGTYHNSESRRSNFIAYRGNWWRAGIVTGYAAHHIEPGVMVFHDFGPLELSAAPFPETWHGKFHDMAVVVNAALRWKLN